MRTLHAGHRLIKVEPGNHLAGYVTYCGILTLPLSIGSLYPFARDSVRCPGPGVRPAAFRPGIASAGANRAKTIIRNRYVCRSGPLFPAGEVTGRRRIQLAAGLALGGQGGGLGSVSARSTVSALVSGTRLGQERRAANRRLRLPGFELWTCHHQRKWPLARNSRLVLQRRFVDFRLGGRSATCGSWPAGSVSSLTIAYRTSAGG